ncbi:hypothetical protein SNEBB_004735 [Seison nebaliae]|nr:hypothetical protein SNEBB_004735 [Seison nebaliae]
MDWKIFIDISKMCFRTFNVAVNNSTNQLARKLTSFRKYFGHRPNKISPSQCELGVIKRRESPSITFNSSVSQSSNVQSIVHFDEIKDARQWVRGDSFKKFTAKESSTKEKKGINELTNVGNSKLIKNSEQFRNNMYTGNHGQQHQHLRSYYYTTDGKQTLKHENLRYKIIDRGEAKDTTDKQTQTNRSQDSLNRIAKELNLVNENILIGDISVGQSKVKRSSKKKIKEEGLPEKQQKTLKRENYTPSKAPTPFLDAQLKKSTIRESKGKFATKPSKQKDDEVRHIAFKEDQSEKKLDQHVYKSKKFKKIGFKYSDKKTFMKPPIIEVKIEEKKSVKKKVYLELENIQAKIPGHKVPPSPAVKTEKPETPEEAVKFMGKEDFKNRYNSVYKKKEIHKKKEGQLNQIKESHKSDEHTKPEITPNTFPVKIELTKVNVIKNPIKLKEEIVSGVQKKTLLKNQKDKDLSTKPKKNKVKFLYQDPESLP